MYCDSSLGHRRNVMRVVSGVGILDQRTALENAQLDLKALLAEIEVKCARGNKRGVNH